MSEAKQMRFLEGALDMTYVWNVGHACGHFLESLKERGRLVGSRCLECGFVAVPPRLVCLRCQARSPEWIDVADRGKLTSFTVVRERFPQQPVQPPYAIVLVRLDGADTDLAHIVCQPECAELEIGMRVRARWRDAGQREGSIFDIEGFEPCQDEEP